MNTFSFWQTLSLAYFSTWIILAFMVAARIYKKERNRCNFSEFLVVYFVCLWGVTYSWMYLVISITAFSLMFQLPYPFNALIPMAALAICFLNRQTLIQLLP